MRKKVLFFDIDGTLWDDDNVIPQSTIDAIQWAQKNGHLAFINSGRSRCFIRRENLLNIGFDGIVSGCGTLIEYHGDVVDYHVLPTDYVEKIVQTVRKYKFRPILEGRYHLYMDDDEFAGEPYGDKLKEEMEEDLLTISEEWGKWEVSKLSCATEPNRHEGCMEELGREFDFMIHSPTVVEMAPTGFSKGSGIETICRILDVDIADTISFGDSVNDRTMLETAGFSVVMGDGADSVKELADFVTRGLHEDGIYHAMKELELI